MPPRFSIIVPTRNRAGLLGRCLSAMGELDYPVGEFEVLVVDDGSDVPVDEVVAAHVGVMAVRYFRTEGVGPATARNLALRHATGEYAVFTDDDCRPRAHWLKGFDEALALHGEAGFGGTILNAPENGIFGRTSQMLVSFLYDYNESTNGLRFFCSNNLMFPREALMAMGGFDESFPLAAAEDRYLCARWTKQGELHFAQGAVIEHRQQLDGRGYFRQQFRYGRGAYQFWQRREHGGDAGNKLLPWHFYSRMLTYPFFHASVGLAFGMSVLLALSQVATALGYFVERAEMERAMPEHTHS